ncbi:hypothetical protein LA6_004213 [Marinibacterium anthonyi]|nr:hypothetical protein LA6_004213 [Marinibacterium anthonyi]
MKRADADVLMTLRALTGADREQLSAWAWRMIDLDLGTPSLSELANEAGVLSGSELSACLDAAFTELGLPRDIDRRTCFVTRAYSDFSAAWDDDFALESSAIEVGLLDHESGPLQYMYASLVDIEDGMPVSIDGIALTSENRADLVRGKVEEWVAANRETLDPLVGMVEALLTCRR